MALFVQERRGGVSPVRCRFAQDGAPAVKASEPGESAIHLPWLTPGSEALAALARHGSVDCWPLIKHDPGAVALLLKHADDDTHSLPPTLFSRPEVLDSAQQSLRASAGFVDWNRAAPAHMLQAALRIAALAESLALRTGLADPAIAWCTGLLTPLGWFGMAAVDAETAAELFVQLHEDAHSHEIWQSQVLGRRLARHWHLPVAVRTVIGYLNLPLPQLQTLGAPDGLAAIVQWAVRKAHDEGRGLGLVVGTDEDTLTQRLHIGEAEALDVCQRAAATDAGRHRWLNPHEQAHLCDLLHLAASQRRLAQAPYGPPVETEIDRLQELLLNQETTESQRLQQMKLKALAEFAAGAGHEINNPLAVISGQGQYLLNRETDSARQGPLRAIIRQAERIHSILTDLMHFAKPPAPAMRPFDMRELVGATIADFRWQLEPKNVQLDFVDSPRAATVNADAEMMRVALNCLLKNALEAAPTNGWIRVSVRVGQDVQVVVEDSGAGPKPAHLEHIFDPFFSGRSAGRGRGMGLPTAWRFLQENGGDVRCEPQAECPARFILSLPTSHLLPHAILRNDESHVERKSA